LGLRSEDLVGVSVIDAFAQNPLVLRELREVLEGRRRRSSIHLDELGIDIESWLEPILDEDGRVVEVAGFSLDVSELRDTQRELAAREQFLRAIIDDLPVAVSVRDGDGRYVVVNRLIAERTGRSVADLLGRSLIETWGRAAAGELAEADQRVLGLGDPEGSELVMGREMDARHVSVRRSPISLPSGEVGVLTVGEDITERTRGLAALEVGEAKSRFFAAVSHELRAPLNSILGFAELLATMGAANLTSVQSRYVANIRAGGDHLLALINDLLDLSRLEVGKLDLRLEAVALAEAAEEVVERMGPLAAAKNIDLRVEPARPRLAAWVDRRRVDQVLYNLISNAIKFTPSGGSISVCVRTQRGEAALSVRDTGVGIKASEHKRIFEEFAQLESGQVAGQAGTGLGLSVTRGLVERMGGSIEVRSASGRGSTFTVMFPSAARQLSVGRGVPERAAGGAPPA
jgi:PAS domain S-box-containing protein